MGTSLHFTEGHVILNEKVGDTGSYTSSNNWLSNSTVYTRLVFAYTLLSSW